MEGELQFAPRRRGVRLPLFGSSSTLRSIEEIESSFLQHLRRLQDAIKDHALQLHITTRRVSYCAACIHRGKGRLRLPLLLCAWRHTDCSRLSFKVKVHLKVRRFKWAASAFPQETQRLRREFDQLRRRTPTSWSIVLLHPVRVSAAQTARGLAHRLLRLRQKIEKLRPLATVKETPAAIQASEALQEQLQVT
eukprot:GHVT01055963.1.p1 GENE.GHVT01055963.1~~GHVT01055963.1.p1  ORF type:complete len:193 (-),score=36.59 GHVT01055963.1:989-1567(-)